MWTLICEAENFVLNAENLQPALFSKLTAQLSRTWRPVRSVRERFGHRDRLPMADTDKTENKRYSKGSD